MKVLFFIVIIFFLVIVCFSAISAKYNSPYSELTIIFGKPGSGKSTKMVHDMIRDLKKGWIVYTDMKEVNYPGIRHINGRDLSQYRTDEHAAVYLDEIGISMSNRDFKNFDKGLVEFFKLHRHFKTKIIVASQNLDCDKKIRDLATNLILQTRVGFLTLSRPIKRDITLTDPTGDSESRVADRLEFKSFFSWKFQLMGPYFKYFDSHSVPERLSINYN